MANYIRTELVQVGERTRELDEAHKNAIKASILKSGLLTPVCLSGEEKLIAGLHRLHALEELHGEGYAIKHDDEIIPFGMIPFVRFSDLSAAQILEMELAENLWRKELAWTERVTALARLHKLQQEENPDATFTETAAKLVGVSPNKNPETVRQAVSRAVVLADAIAADPSLASARSEADAFSRVKSDITRVASSLLADGFTATHTEHRLIEGSLIEVLPTLERASIDLIFTDPPYGVGADTWTSKFKDNPHDYKDTWAHASALYLQIFKEGFRITKDQGVLVAWCAIERWHTLRELAEQYGWSCWTQPVIWVKSNEGIAPWGQKGFTRCYEALLFASKGGRGLLGTRSDVITGHYKVRDREHGAAKPVDLYSSLIKSILLPGETILDPCCGSGTIFEAATLTGNIATGIEINPHFVGLSQQRLNKTREDIQTVDLNIPEGDAF